MKPSALLTALLACCLCVGIAEARGNNNRKVPVDEFKKLDKNHDGLLSPEEFGGGSKGKASAEFEKLDKNHDGFLDRYEFSQRSKKH